MKQPAFFGAAIVSCVLLATSAQAQVRVFVAAHGDDTRRCASESNPCRTLDHAVARVAAGGDVIVTRSGSYGGASITKSVKISAAPGVTAIVDEPITVDPGAAGTAVLRGLTLLPSAPGSNCVSHSSGRLQVEHLTIDGCARGVFSRAGAGDLFVTDTTIRNATEEALRVDAANHTFVEDSRFENGRIDAFFVNGTAEVTIDRSAFVRAGYAGLHVQGAAKIWASRSVFAQNAVGVLVLAPGGAGAEVSLSDSELVDNIDLWGLSVSNGIARISGCTVTGNQGGISQNLTGVIESYGNNRVRGNGLDTLGTITVVSLQ